MMVDEADIDIVGSTSSSSTSSSGSLSAKGALKRTLTPSDGGSGIGSPRAPPNKRKPGPIPKDVVVRRPSYSPGSRSPSVSPVPWQAQDTKTLFSGGNVEANVPSYSTSLSGPAIIPNSMPASPTLPDKLVNGLADIPSIPIFEPIPVETNETPAVAVAAAAALPESTPAFTPTISNNINDSAKIVEVSNERRQTTETVVKTEFNKVNDSASENDTNAESAVQERLTNNVDHDKRDVKPEKERVLTKKELDDIRRHNLSIRELVYKEVRRRGTSE